MMPNFRPAALCLIVAAFTLVAPRGAGAQRYVDGHSFFFTMTDDDGKPISGVMHVAGDRARIDMADADEPDGKRDDYILLADGGRRVMLVHPEKRTYSVTTGQDFERIIGTAMRAVDALLTMEVADLTVAAERVSDSETVANQPTRHFRVVREFAVDIGVMGKTERQHHLVTTEYWAPRDFSLPRNPVVELVMNAQTALAQSDADFVRRSREARDTLFTGAPLRMIVRSESREEDGGVEVETQHYEVTRVSKSSLAEASLEVPRGYRRTKGDWSFNLDE